MGYSVLYTPTKPAESSALKKQVKSPQPLVNNKLLNKYPVTRALSICLRIFSMLGNDEVPVVTYVSATFPILFFRRRYGFI